MKIYILKKTHFCKLQAVEYYQKPEQSKCLSNNIVKLLQHGLYFY